MFFYREKIKMASVEGETAVQLFNRLCGKPKLFEIGNKIFGHDAERFVEMAGPPSSGKTEILMHIVLNIITPDIYNGIQLNGLESSVIFIDTSYKFSMLRFVKLIEQRLIMHCNDHQNTEISESFVKSCLKRFFKITCSSSKELLVSLNSLELFLRTTSDVLLLVIDDVCAYEWINKLETGKRKTSDITQNVYSVLKKYVEQHNLNVVLAKQDLYQTNAISPICKYQIQIKDINSNSYSLKRKNYVFYYRTTPNGLEFTP